MTVPTSVAITSLSNSSNLNLSNNNQVATSCVSLVSSTNGSTPFSIPFSIGSTPAANSQQQQTTMSWAQGNPIQFATVVPQQTIYQMPNDTLLQPQTMLFTQPSSRPPDQATNNQTTPIVQIISTPNGPAQFIQTSTGLNKQTTTYTTNLINNNSTNTTTNSKSNNKQILPKGSKSKKNSDQSNCTNSTSINSKSSSSTSSKTMITTSLASNNDNSNINNFTTNLSQSTLGTPQFMINSQPSFFTSNGLFFNQTMPTISTMGQQQFIINPTSQLTANPASNTQTANKTVNQPNQTIIIPSSGTTNNNQLKVQPTGLMQQNSTPQLIQLPNGQMILVQAAQPTSAEQQPTIIQNYNQSNTPTLQLIQPDGQTVSYSSANNSNFIFTSQPSFVNSSISTNNLLTTTTFTNANTIASTNNNNNNKSKSRRRPPAKKDNNKTTTTNAIAPITTTTIINTNKVDTTPTEQNKSKGLNLADLLKEAGIMDGDDGDMSTLLGQTANTTTDLLDQSLNLSTNMNTTNTSTPQLSTLDLNDQQSTAMITGNLSSSTALAQPTVMMMPTNTGQVGQNGANYFFNPINQSIGAATAPVNNGINSSINQPQFKLAWGPDGSMILQQTMPTFAQPIDVTNQLNQPTVQSKTTKLVDTSKQQLDSCNSGSSINGQPSPDSTTPTLDSAITPTSCSSLTVTTSTITFTTNNSISTNSNSQLGSIKLTDSMSLAIQNSGLNKDDQSQSQTSNTSVSKSKSRSKKSTAKKQTISVNVKQELSPQNKTSSNSTSTNLQQSTQQLITIPIQTNLNSSINTVIPNTNTGTVILSDNTLINNTIKNNDSSSILVLNNSTSTNQTTNSTGPVPLTTHIDQGGVPVVQISLNNQEFLERLDNQVKSLSSVKNPTPEQDNLLQELKSLQMKMIQAKTNCAESGDNNIILTTHQPIISQPTQQSTGAISTTNKSSPNNKLTKDKFLNNPTNNVIKNLNNQTVISINKLDTDSLQSGKKLGIGTGGLMDQNKQTTQTTTTTLQGQPTQFIIQSNAPTTTMKSGLGSQDPGTTTNTFEGQKIKILTTSNTNQSSTPQTGTTYQFFITTAGKNPLQNQLNTDGTSTGAVYQVLHLQPPTNTLNNIEIINNNAKLIKLTDSQLKDTISTTPDKSKSKSPKFSFQQQLSADCSAACKPDTRTPFKNCNDACKRLLRYHVFHHEDVKKETLNKFDNDFEVLSQYLLHKREKLYRRFQYNVLKLSMKSHSLAENIMLDKTFVEDEKICIKDDKELVAKGDSLNLPEPPIEWRLKIKNLIDEEVVKYNEEQESKKRKHGESRESDEQSDLKKKSELPSGLINEIDNDVEDSEVSDEESNDMQDINKLLNLSDDEMNMQHHMGHHIDVLSPLYNHDNNLQSHHSSEFNLFDPDWQTTTDTNSSSMNANNNNQQSNKPASSNWGVQEDAVAVSSILGGQVNQSESNYIDSSLNHHSIPNLDGFDTEENDNNANQLNFNQSNSTDLMFDHSKNDSSNSHPKMNSDNDIQMQSAIDSILDILVPSTSTNVDTNENGISSAHDGLVDCDQLSSNGFNVNFDTSNSQVNFSQQNNFLDPMPSIGMQSRSTGSFGTDHYDQIDEAVKSILS